MTKRRPTVKENGSSSIFSTFPIGLTASDDEVIARLRAELSRGDEPEVSQRQVIRLALRFAGQTNVKGRRFSLIRNETASVMEERHFGQDKILFCACKRLRRKRTSPLRCCRRLISRLSSRSQNGLPLLHKIPRAKSAIVVGADMLRRELDPVPEAARGLRLEKLRNEVHDVPELLRRAIAARPAEQRRLLNAMAVCALEGCWFPLTVQIAGLTLTR
jgi:hypothetical protein